MIFQSPGAVFLKLGPLTVRWYGVMFTVAFAACTFFATKMAQRRGIDETKLVNCALLSFVGGIVGARLYYVMLTWSHFATHWMEIAATWNGGLSIHGGIIGASIFGAAYCWRAKIPFLQMWDIIGSSVPLGQAIGRWGNFFNSELFGRPVSDDFPLKLFIPPGDRPSQYLEQQYFHPTFLYESVWDLLTFLLLYFIVAERLRKYPGVTFFVYLLLYSIGRLLIEPMRTDSIMAGTIQVPMIASAASVVIALAGIAILLLKYNRSNPAAKVENEQG